jgi:hypothetical protein
MWRGGIGLGGESREGEGAWHGLHVREVSDALAPCVGEERSFVGGLREVEGGGVVIWLCWLAVVKESKVSIFTELCAPRAVARGPKRRLQRQEW